MLDNEKVKDYYGCPAELKHPWSLVASRTPAVAPVWGYYFVDVEDYPDLTEIDRITPDSSPTSAQGMGTRLSGRWRSPSGEGRRGS